MPNIRVVVVMIMILLTAATMARYTTKTVTRARWVKMFPSTRLVSDTRMLECVWIYMFACLPAFLWRSAKSIIFEVSKGIVLVVVLHCMIIYFCCTPQQQLANDRNGTNT